MTIIFNNIWDNNTENTGNRFNDRYNLYDISSDNLQTFLSVSNIYCCQIAKIINKNILDTL